MPGRNAEAPKRPLFESKLIHLVQMKAPKVSASTFDIKSHIWYLFDISVDAQVFIAIVQNLGWQRTVKPKNYGSYGQNANPGRNNTDPDGW